MKIIASISEQINKLKNSREAVPSTGICCGRFCHPAEELP
jgi:hypothetical protein